MNGKCGLIFLIHAVFNVAKVNVITTFCYFPLNYNLEKDRVSIIQLLGLTLITVGIF